MFHLVQSKKVPLYVTISHISQTHKTTAQTSGLHLIFSGAFPLVEKLSIPLFRVISDKYNWNKMVAHVSHYQGHFTKISQLNIITGISDVSDYNCGKH